MAARLRFLVLALLLAPARAQLPQRPAASERQEPRPVAQAASLVDATLERMVRRGIAYLAGKMGRDGSYDLGDAQNPAPVAVTALATLALLANGDLPGRSPRGQLVESGLIFLLNQQSQVAFSTAGRPARNGYFESESDKYSKMHGHGYATLALAEAYGMLDRSREGRIAPTRLHDALVAAVHRIEQSQEAETGGFYYDPVPLGHEGSVTICVVQALRAARNAGIQVDAKVIDRAVDYVRRSQLPDGSFCYALGQRDKTSSALTAAAISTLNATGEYDSEAIRKGIEWLDRTEPLRRMLDKHMGDERFPHYERLYLAQAYFQHRDEALFRRWFPEEVKVLESQQQADGSWESKQYGSVYATAMNTLVLLIPFQFLPILQR